MSHRRSIGSTQEIILSDYLPGSEGRMDSKDKLFQALQRTTPEVLELDQSQMLPNRDIMEEESDQALLDS